MFYVILLAFSLTWQPPEFLWEKFRQSPAENHDRRQATKTHSHVTESNKYLQNKQSLLTCLNWTMKTSSDLWQVRCRFLLCNRNGRHIRRCVNFRWIKLQRRLRWATRFYRFIIALFLLITIMNSDNVVSCLDKIYLCMHFLGVLHRTKEQFLYTTARRSSSCGDLAEAYRNNQWIIYNGE